MRPDANLAIKAISTMLGHTTTSATPDFPSRVKQLCRPFRHMAYSRLNSKRRFFALMNSVSFLIRRCFVVCVAILMMAGCAGSQMQTTPPVRMPPSLASTSMSPLAADCPIVGKTYTRGGSNGQVSMTFQEAYAKIGAPTRLRTRLVYSHWPEKRQYIYLKI
jgi:hypothetical protein